MTMTEFETPFFRDLEKFLTPILAGVLIAIVAVLGFIFVLPEIQFNIDGALEGYNVLTERNGQCFQNENSWHCRSSAWYISILYILPLPILTGLNIYLWRLRKKYV